MTATLHRYYRPSAAAPISGSFTLMTVGVLAAAVAGTIYAALARYNPLIYFTFIGACFCGGAVGLALQYGARVGRVRNRMVVWGVSAFVGLLTVYFSWVAYIYLLSDLITFQPQIVWQIVQLLAQNGVWEIRGSTPTGGALYTVWAIEAALIGGITMLMGSSTVVPFCESCQLWTEPQILETQVPLENAADFAQAMENEQYSALYALSGGNVNEDD